MTKINVTKAIQNINREFKEQKNKHISSAVTDASLNSQKVLTSLPLRAQTDGT